MRMSKTSRLLAVLLALLLALGSMPTALAQGLVFPADQYDAWLEAAIADFVNMDAAGQYSVIVALEDNQEQQEALLGLLSEEQSQALTDYAMTQVEPMVIESVTFTDAGPFMPPVSVNSARPMRMMAFAARSNATDNPGVITSKELTWSEEEGYKLRIESYVTGETKVTTETKSIPVDIVLVLDQSGSMAYDFSGNSTNTNTSRRQYAMKQAVNNFIGAVADKYNETDSDHRIAIVTFGSGASTLQDWTYVDASGETTLTGKISNLPNSPSGATNVAAGMTTAETLMGSGYNYTGKNTQRQKVVIVFTDGVPTTSSEFNTTVATNAIASAKNLKDAGATVYTVGIFNGVNADQLYGSSTGDVGASWSAESFLGSGDVDQADIAAGNRFLNYLSSNFEDASEIGLTRDVFDLLIYTKVEYEITKNFTRTASNYYLTATDSTSLNNIFTQISENIQTGTASVTLGAQTVVQDVISDYFELPANADASKIAVYTALYKKDGTWGADTASGLTPSINGKTVSVTGFDFSLNYCSTDNGRQEGNDGETGDFYGRKLIIEIPIVVRDGFWGGNNVPTNGAASGIYTGGENSTLVENFEAPKANVPLNVPALDTEDKNIYLLNAAPEMGDLYNKADFAEATGDNAWKTEFVEIIADSTTGTISNTEDTTVDIKITVSASETADSTSVGTPVIKPVEREGSAKVNVFKPVLTFQDTVRDYMTDVTGYDYDTANLVSTEWKHGTTDEADVTMTGTAPKLTLTPDNAESTWITDNKVTGLSDVAVNMTVTINNQDVTGYTTSYRNACSDSQCNYKGGNGATNEFTPEFIVHIRNIYGALKVSKTVPAVSGDVAQPSADDTFTFTVTFGDGKTYTYQKYDAAGNAIGTATPGNTFTLKNGEYVIFDKITAKTTYKVVETDNPADYYTPTTSEITGTIVAATMVEAVFTNTYTKLNDGNLTITKVVKKSDFTGDTFNFTVKLNDATEVGQKQFAEKIAELANSEALKNIVAWNADDKCATVTIAMDAQTKTTTVTLTDLPVGSYTVTEVLTPVQAANYKTAAAEQTVNVTKDGTAVVTVTNTAIGTYDKVDVTKTWDDNSDKLELRPDEIDVYLTGTTDANGVVYNATEPTWTTTTGDEWTGKWINVPKYDNDGNLIKYEVTETQVTNYDAPSITGNLTDGFKVTNSIAVGDLAITKKVEDEDATDDVTPDANQEFTFTVTLPEGTYNFTGSKTGTIVNGGTITLKNGESVTIENLPKAAAYTVTETVPTGYTVNQKTFTGNIIAGTTQTAAFTNTFKVADLTISKTISGADDNTTDDVFSFVVTIGGQPHANGKYFIGDNEYTADNTGMIKITGENSAVIKNIPINTGYSVVEVQNMLPTGYTLTTKNGDIGSISESGSAASFTNTYTTGTLNITKNVVGTDAPADSFEFTINFYTDDAKTTAQGGSFTCVINGTSTTISNGSKISLTNGQTAKITGIPVGTVYAVAETTNTNYTTTSTNANGTISEAASDAVFTNTYKYSSLTITKQFNNCTPEAGETFLFTVTGPNDYSAEVVIAGAGSVTIKHLLLGEYTVTEADDWSWRYSSSSDPENGKTTLTATEYGKVTITNTKSNDKWLDGNTSNENIFNK